MTISVEHLPWDSRFFGTKIGRLVGRGSRDDVAYAVSRAMSHEFKCLYSLIPCDDRQMVYGLTSTGFKLVDVRVEMERDLDDGEPTQNRLLDISLSVDSDVPELVAASRGTFNLSRFYSDPRFSKEKCDDLYAAWIARDCSSNDRIMVVAEHLGKLAGFWSASIDATGIAQTGLGFVSPELRGKGVPTAMMAYMVRKLRDAGVKTLRAATQGANVAAVKMHLKCGFKFSATKLWYHGHL